MPIDDVCDGVNVVDEGANIATLTLLGALATVVEITTYTGNEENI